MQQDGSGGHTYGQNARGAPGAVLLAARDQLERQGVQPQPLDVVFIRN